MFFIGREKVLLPHLLSIDFIPTITSNFSLILQLNVENNDRFLDEFGTGTGEDKEEVDGNESSNPQKSSKPSDFQVLFGGNNNDHFMIGIKFTRYPH